MLSHSLFCTPELWPSGRVSALQEGDQGLIPGWVRPKTVRSGTGCLLLGTQHEGLDWWMFPWDVAMCIGASLRSYSCLNI